MDHELLDWLPLDELLWLLLDVMDSDDAEDVDVEVEDHELLLGEDDSLLLLVIDMLDWLLDELCELLDVMDSDDSLLLDFSLIEDHEDELREDDELLLGEDGELEEDGSEDEDDPLLTELTEDHELLLWLLLDSLLLLDRSSIDRIWSRLTWSLAGPGNCRLPVLNGSTSGTLTSPEALVSVRIASQI